MIFQFLALSFAEENSKTEKTVGQITEDLRVGIRRKIGAAAEAVARGGHAVARSTRARFEANGDADADAKKAVADAEAPLED